MKASMTMIGLGMRVQIGVKPLFGTKQRALKKVKGMLTMERMGQPCGSMVCIPHAIQVRLVFCMFVPIGTSGMTTFGFGEQSWNSFVNLLLQVWFAPVGAFMATFSDEFGVFDLYDGIQLVWSCYHMDLMQQVIFAEILYRDARFVCFWRNHTFTLM